MRYLFSSKLKGFSGSDWGRFLFKLKTKKKILPEVSTEKHSGLEITDKAGSDQVWWETQKVAEDVNDNITADQAVGGGMKQEREHNYRTPEEAMGFFLLGNKFDRKQYLNPIWWMNIKWFTKNSIIKNMKNANDYITKPYEKSPLKYSRLQSALLSETIKPTYSAITSGRIKNLDNVSLLALKDLKASILPQFDQTTNDISRRLKFVGGALSAREGLKKHLYLQKLTNTDKRYQNAGKHIIKELAYAKKEVGMNIDLLIDEQNKRIESTHNAVENYKTRQEVRGDTKGKQGLWKFLKNASDDPSKFLKSSGIFREFNWKKEFGTSCAVDILDTIQVHYSDFIISTDRLARVYDTMKATIENVKAREKNKEEYAPKADFVRLQKSLRSLRIEMAPKGEASDVESVVEGVNKAAQRPPLNIDIEETIYKGAEIRLTNEERIFYLVNYFNNNPKHLQALDDDAKQLLLRWLYDTNQDADKKYRSGGFSEEAPINLRKYALENALRVQQLAKKAVDVLPQMNVAIRKKDPTEFQNIIQQLKGFVASYDDLFEVLETVYGKETDAKKLIEKLPPSEREVLENLKVLDSFKKRLKGESVSTDEEGGGTTGIIKDLEDTRNKFDTDVLKKMIPSDELYRSRKAHMEQIQDALIKADDPSSGITLEQTRYDSLQKAFNEIYTQIKTHEEAVQGQQSDYLELPPSADAWGKIVGELKDRDIQRQLNELGRDEAGEGEFQMPDANDMMRRMILNKGAVNMEKHFKEVLKVRSAQQWDILSQTFMDGGFTIPELHYANTTRQNREITVPGGVVNEKILKDVTVVRMEGANFICETKDKKHVVKLKMREGKNIEAFIWDHPGEEQWNVPQTEPKIFATVLNLKIDDRDESAPVPPARSKRQARNAGKKKYW